MGVTAEKDIKDTIKNDTPRNVAVIGASGSIGSSALDVIAYSRGRLRASVLAVNRSVVKLAELARKFKPDVVVVADPNTDRAPLKDIPAGTEVLVGPEALDEVVRRPEVDVVLISIVALQVCALLGAQSTLVKQSLLPTRRRWLRAVLY